MSDFLNSLGNLNAWGNAAGFLGLLPPAQTEFGKDLGVFLPSPLSLNPRDPVENRCLVSYPGGVLLHTGLPNPGIKKAVQTYSERWSRLPMPVWLNLLPNNADEAAQLSEIVDELENTAASVITLPTSASREERKLILNAARGEKPFLAEIPLDMVNGDLVDCVRFSEAAGVVLGAPRGRLFKDGKWVNGRLYGPALFPQVIAALRLLRRTGKPILVGCGVCSLEQGEQLLHLGVEAVLVDVLLWG